jgi:hypothetical protein
MACTMIDIVVLLLAVGACGSEGAPGPQPTPPAPTPALPAQPAATSKLRVHEWGLIDVQLAASTGRVSAVPATRRRPASAGASRAPLLYFHLDQGAEPVDVTVRVTMQGGTVGEHWPAGELAGSTVTWTGRVRSENCRGSSYPATGEASLLAAYETPDSSCITVSGADYNHLFFAGTARIPMPLEITDANEGIRLHNPGPGEILGPVYVVQRSDDRTATRVSGQLAHPRSPITMVPQWPTSELALPPYDTVLRYGLTMPERASFMRAWEDALFGRDPSAPRDLPAPADQPARYVLYWLPEALASQVATIEITPPPAEIHRAYAMRVALP